MNHLHFHPHPHHLPLQMMQQWAGQFDEVSPLRKLFRSSMDFECSIEMILRGPVHETVNMIFILKTCEGILNEIEQQGIEIKPIEDGLAVESYSHHFTKMTLPLQFPKTIFEANPMELDASLYLGEGPPERILANTLLVSVLYYIDLYFQTKKMNHYEN